MRTIKVSKRVTPGALQAELAAIPELAPTPTGPDGRLESPIVVEVVGPKSARIHVPDDFEDDEAVAAVVKVHVAREEVTADPAAEALERLRARADEGDEAARDLLLILGA
jgi:hypothetical protein